MPDGGHRAIWDSLWGVSIMNLDSNLNKFIMKGKYYFFEIIQLTDKD